MPASDQNEESMEFLGVFASRTTGAGPSAEATELPQEDRWGKNTGERTQFSKTETEWVAARQKGGADVTSFF